MKLIERRLELLDMEGNGFSRPEIVKHLSEKFQCSDRMIYYDFTRKPQWQPSIQQLKEEHVLMKVLNRYEHTYRKAAFSALQAQSWQEKHSALKIMNDSNRRFYETALPDRARLQGEMKLTQDKPFIIKKWSREDADATKQK